MARIAYSYGWPTIHSVDLNTQVRTSLQKLSSNASEFDIDEDGTIYYLMSNGYRQIRKVMIGASSGVDALHYEHPTYIRDIAIRRVNGNPRLYFSATGANGLAVIYYLSEQNTPIEYFSVNPSDIMLFNPCTGQNDIAFYRGDFAFGGDDTLYISNGNIAPCGIYRITGAGPDAVHGTVERISLHSDAVQGLTCDPQHHYLYFRKAAQQIARLGLATLWEEPVYTVNLAGVEIVDIAFVPAQILGPPPSWSFVSIPLFRWLWFHLHRAVLTRL
jgi:hypothetical protein